MNKGQTSVAAREDWPRVMAFHFTVVVPTLGMDKDASFSEVDGLSTELRTDSLRAGGENRGMLELPTGSAGGRLKLKRGMLAERSPLLRWCWETIEFGLARPIVRRQVRVQLLGMDHEPLRTWTCEDAYPVRYEVGGLSSQRNEVAVETIELVYARALQGSAS